MLILFLLGTSPVQKKCKVYGTDLKQSRFKWKRRACQFQHFSKESTCYGKTSYKTGLSCHAVVDIFQIAQHEK